MQRVQVSSSVLYLGLLCLHGESGGAIVLGKLSLSGRLPDMDNSRARAYCACSRCGWGLFEHFFSHLSLSLSLPDGLI